MVNFPAILVGGPPHSGKSVLVYSLTRALRERDVSHYVLRACPDGEGDWSNEGDGVVVRAIRRKGRFNQTFEERVAGYLGARHLPLLVDVGGMPTEAQQGAFGLCTGAILLVGERVGDPAAFERDLGAWRGISAAVGLPLVAELRSELEGVDELEAREPVIRGTVVGLERGRSVDGPAFLAVVDRLEALFEESGREAAAYHRSTTPEGARFVDLEAVAREQGGNDGRWVPGYLPVFVEGIKGDGAVAIYGRAPNWVYGAAAAWAKGVVLFDVRYGWMRLPVLPLIGDGSGVKAQDGWGSLIEEREAYTWVELYTGSQYFDPDEPEGLPLPVLSPRAGRGLVIGGKLPNWLLMAAVKQMGVGWEWTAVYQMPLGGAVVVDSVVAGRKVGEFMGLVPPERTG